MAENELNVRIRHAVHTTTEWTNINPILKLGEIVVDSTVHRTKTGNGTSKWTALPYDDQSVYDQVASHISATATTSNLGHVKVDSSLSSSSTNPVQNKAVYNALSGKSNTGHTHTKSNITDFNVQLISENLNNITTVGLYYAVGDNTVSNKPAGVTAFGMEVMRSAGGWYTQVLYTPAGLKTYLRWYDGNSNGWTPWQETTILTPVPSNAKFTDTVYTHPTSSGNKHIPSGGSSGQILRWSADGTAVWGNDNNTTYSVGTANNLGLTKLYTGTGTNTDGTMTQAALKTALDGKSNNGHTHTLLSNLYPSRPASADIVSTGSGGISTFKATSNMTTSKPANDGHIIHFFWDNTGGYDAQLTIPISASSAGCSMQFRGQSAGIWGSWKTILDSSNYNNYAPTKMGTGASGTWGINVTGSAAKWSTARTITLTGSVTGSVSIDGSGNVSLVTTTNHSHSYLPLSGGTMSGDLYFSNNNGNIIWNSGSYWQRIKATDDSTAGTSVFQFQQSSDSGANWTDLFKILDNGNVVATTYNGYTLAAACAKGVTDSSSASAISTGTSLVTERDVYYGLPIINNSHSYTSSTAIYAPTSGGTLGYELIGNGITAPPVWKAPSYGICSTAADTIEKVVTCTGFRLYTGAEITVKFTVTNTAASPTLNVNSTGAKAIYYRGGAISAGYLAANRTYKFMYNGTQYELVGDVDTNSDYKVTQTNTTDNADYRILLSANANDTTETSTSKKSTNLKFNPSTGNLTAIKFTGNLNGNASSATTANNALLLKTLNSNTSITSSTWRGSITRGVVVWGQSFKNSTDITDSSGNGITDTGDLSLWLAPSGSMATLNMTIDGDYYCGDSVVLNASNYSSTLNSSYIRYTNAEGYPGFNINGNTSNWIRTTLNGLIPYQSGNAGNGHGSLGTSSWYFSGAYIDNISCVTSTASNGFTCTGGGLKLPANGMAWIGGKTSTACVYNVDAQSVSSYHPMMRINTYSGNVWNIGGLCDDVGIYGYYAARTENGYDWSTTWNTGTGKLTHSKDMSIGGTLSVGNGINQTPVYITGYSSGEASISYAYNGLSQRWVVGPGAGIGNFDNFGFYNSEVGPVLRLHKNGELAVNGQIIAGTSTANAFRAVFGNYGFIIRNDGGNTYLMTTAAGDPYGSWNKYITINNADCATSFPANITISSGDLILNNGWIYLKNNMRIRSYNSSGTVADLIHWNSDNRIYIGSANVKATKIRISQTCSNIGVLNSSGSWVTITTGVSDIREKNSIEDLQKSKQIIMGLKSKRFKYNDPDDDRWHLGFIAQDVRKTLDTTIGDCAILEYNNLDPYENHPVDINDENTFTYSMRYYELIPPHVALTQEHEREIQTLKRENQLLKSEMKQLKEIVQKHIIT